jgi:hypothetical protein
MRVRPTFTRRLSLLMGVFLILLAFATTASAKERHLKKFYSEIVVLPSGSVDVTENITFQFVGGPWHGINRYIPVEYSGPRGLNYTLFLDVKGVTDETGAKLRYETSRERQYLNLKIFIPEADNSTRTISINYTVSDALKFFDDHDEFYWNVTGDEWSIPIESAGAHIVFPQGTSNLRAKAFTGAYRSTGHDADVLCPCTKASPSPSLSTKAPSANPQFFPGYPSTCAATGRSLSRLPPSSRCSGGGGPAAATRASAQSPRNISRPTI